ncbi:hypothetical protein K9M59_01115 [Candidatus Gracilibacteria bacterium]|nr:hypothetical protein [Candidatus Gracilibacteria bacterium]MCF7819168.1 hypothetical protein [Candidatus Gracilibacteria bacterium]
MNHLRSIFGAAILLGAFLVPSSVSAQVSPFGQYQLMLPKRNVDRSLDISRNYSGNISESRGQRLYQNQKKAVTPFSTSSYQLKEVKKESPEYFEFEKPALLPWESLHYKNRVKKAYQMTDRYEGRYKDPILDSRPSPIQYNRKYRSAKNELDGQRSGRNKLYNWYLR